AVDEQGSGTRVGSQTATPIAVLSLQLLGRGKDFQTMAGLTSFNTWKPEWTGGPAGQRPLYTWYYATQALFHAGGTEWDRWHGPFVRMLMSQQNADGSWTPYGRQENAYGPVYGTTLSALSLMVYIRILPSYGPIEIISPIPQGADRDIGVEILDTAMFRTPDTRS
ncbi:MAG: hypothetical protein U1E27_02795, partial [Kiritimatiellia bacterium]|nr:hypothetical protein [Kiritimatiellia bacterium]